MKKLAICLSILMLGCQGFCADVVQPEQSFEDNKAVVSIQKQPAAESTQKQNVKNNWFCIVVQVNGKVKDTDTADK